MAALWGRMNILTEFGVPLENRRPLRLVPGFASLTRAFPMVWVGPVFPRRVLLGLAVTLTTWRRPVTWDVSNGTYATACRAAGNSGRRSVVCSYRRRLGSKQSEVRCLPVTGRGVFEVSKTPHGRSGLRRQQPRAGGRHDLFRVPQKQRGRRTVTEAGGAGVAGRCPSRRPAPSVAGGVCSSVDDAAVTDLVMLDAVSPIRKRPDASDGTAYLQDRNRGPPGNEHPVLEAVCCLTGDPSKRSSRRSPAISRKY